MFGLAGLAVAASMVFGQAQPLPSQYEHLKSYDSLIGTWCYKGPVLDEVPGIAKDGTPLVVHWSWGWILKKSVVETNWTIKLEGVEEITGKSLIGWDPAAGRIIVGGLTSTGGYDLGTATVNEQKKTWNSKHEGVNWKGEKTTVEQMIEIKDSDTFLFRVSNRHEGDRSPKDVCYTFKRCKCEKP